MIDYNLTIQKFFDTAIQYLEKRASLAKDTDELEYIHKTLDYMHVVKQDPANYYNYSKTMDTLYGFLRGNDNSVLLAVRNVLYKISQLYDRPKDEERKNDLLQAIKSFNYSISTNILRDFIYPFRSVKSFAVNVNAEKSK